MKKLCLLCFAILLSVLLFASCGKGGGDAAVEKDGNVIYSNEVSTFVIKPSSGEIPSLNAIFDRIYELTGLYAPISTDTSPQEMNEIVVGDTTRPITAKAHEKLQKKIDLAIRDAEDNNQETDDLVGYGVYAEGGWVALVWNDPVFAQVAISDFVEKFLVAESLELEDGYFYSNVVSFREYKKAIANAEREKAFADMEPELGVETVDALRRLYSLFDDRYYLWIANLYDPGEYDEEGNPLGGGFYFSNSARDNVGYEIDLESTMQVLNFIKSPRSGFFGIHEADLSEVLPEKMKNELLAFARSLQSPADGYFYHPQWSAVGTSRLSRDLKWATQLFVALGEKPYWNTPSGLVGEYGAPGISRVSLTGSLSNSDVTAVSALISAAKGESWTGSSQLSSVDAWKSYINGLMTGIRTNSWSVANNLVAQYLEILERERIAIKNGELSDPDGDGIANGGYIRTVESIVNGYQLENNGVWEVGSVDDNTICYNAVNGLMKFSELYTNLGLEIKYADAAMESALHMITFEGKDAQGNDAPSSCDVFNPLVCVYNLLKNIEKFGDAKDADTFRARIRSNAAEMINVSATKIAKFKKNDGSIGMSEGPGNGLSQGAAVAVNGVNEGNVNGADIVTGVASYLCNILGVRTIPMFSPTDWDFFIYEINGLEPVIKAEGDYKNEPMTFDDDPTGVAPNGVSITGGNDSATVVPDKREGAEGNVVEFISKAGIGNAMWVIPKAGGASGCYVVDFDICIEKTNMQGTAMQIKIGRSYMFTLGFFGSGVYIGDGSAESGAYAVSNRYGNQFEIGEWANIRVEYYPSEKKEEIRAKIYVNGSLIAVSDNYKGQRSNVDVAPTVDFTSVEFYCFTDYAMTILYDNVLVEKNGQSFHLDDGHAAVNFAITNSTLDVDFGVTSTGRFAASAVDYTDLKFTGLSGDGATADVVYEGDNSILRIAKREGGSAVASFLKKSMTASVYYAETDIKWLSPKEFSTGECFTLSAVSEKYNRGAAAMATIRGFVNKDGKLDLSFTDPESAFATLERNRWYNLNIAAIPHINEEGVITVRVNINGVTMAEEEFSADEASIESFRGFVIDMPENGGAFTLDIDNTYVGVGITTSHPEVEYNTETEKFEDGSLSTEHCTNSTISGVSLESVFSLSTDPVNAANRVLRACSPKSGNRNYAGYTTVKNSSADNGDDAVYSSLSLDLYYSSEGITSSVLLSNVQFKHSVLAFALDFYMDVDRESGEKTLRICAANNSPDNTGAQGGGSGSATLAEGVHAIDRWFNLRIDFCKCGTDSVISLYIDGVCYAEDLSCYYGENLINRSGAVTTVQWYHQRTGVVTYMDNLSYGCSAGEAFIGRPEDSEGELPDGDLPSGGDTDMDSSMIEDGWVSGQ